MVKTLFEAIGYTLGKKAAQAKNAFDLVGGTEEESLRAEIRLGGDLAAAVLERVPLVVENEATRFAAQIGHWLVGNVKEKKLPFIVRVTAEREPNALSLLLRQASGRHAASAWLSKAGRQLLDSAYSRDDEFEADVFAVALVGTAGGDVLAGERLLEKLAQGTSGQSVGIVGNYLATHPPLMERVANLRARRPG